MSINVPSKVCVCFVVVSIFFVFWSFFILCCFACRSQHIHRFFLYCIISSTYSLMIDYKSPPPPPPYTGNVQSVKHWAWCDAGRSAWCLRAITITPNRRRWRNAKASSPPTPFVTFAPSSSNSIVVASIDDGF
jgi:hypothetical protein